MILSKKFILSLLIYVTSFLMLYRHDIGLRIKIAVFIAMGLSDIIYYLLTLDKNERLQ